MGGEHEMVDALTTSKNRRRCVWFWDRWNPKLPCSYQSRNFRIGSISTERLSEASAWLTLFFKAPEIVLAELQATGTAAGVAILTEQSIAKLICAETATGVAYGIFVQLKPLVGVMSWFEI